MYVKFWKKIMDFFFSLIAVIILSPVLLLLSIIGLMLMRGNPFFVQMRPGKIDKKTGKEKIIPLIKFRTMSNEKNSKGELLPDNERVTGYGKFLRRTSIDELPSLLNILAGQLSFIGPRPLLIKYLEDYSEKERKRHLVRPGMTGLAQVSGRNAITWKEKFEKDIEYVNNVSFGLDVKLFFITIKKVFVREGIEFTNKGTIKDYFAGNDRI